MDEFSSSVTVFKEMIDGLPVFASLEKTSEIGSEEYDEKHYFVVPFELSEYGFALHTMRCLPKSVPEINNLPKRRVFHFPHEHAENQLKQYMLEGAREIVQEKGKDNISTLESLANNIDALDKKLTYGMLLVGGLAAIVNPLVGVGIAAKALMPGISGLVNTYGLRPSGEKLSQIQLEREITEAENDVTKEFESANTLRVINPILAELYFALSTTEDEHDPLLDPNQFNGSIAELSHERWRQLTELAICHVYKEVYSDTTQHRRANLGPEDIRWLKVLYDSNPD